MRVNCPVLTELVDELSLAPGLDRLKRRPLLTQHPYGPTFFAGILVTLLALGGFAVIATWILHGFFDWAMDVWPYWLRKTILQNLSQLILVVLVRIFFHAVHQPVRRCLSMYAYSRWLHTFSEEFSAPPIPLRTRLWNGLSRLSWKVQRPSIRRSRPVEALDQVSLLTQEPYANEDEI